MSGYLRKLRREIARVAPQLQGGRVYRIEICHDDWCPKLIGGACCCDAEVGTPKLVARPTVGAA